MQKFCVLLCISSCVALEIAAPASTTEYSYLTTGGPTGGPVTTTSPLPTTTTLSRPDGFNACKRQSVFDIMMCTSHACTECILSWCPETCQKIQEDFPDCRCPTWPSSRLSFSGGDFEGKGKFGDEGDYADGTFTTASPR